MVRKRIYGRLGVISIIALFLASTLLVGNGVFQKVSRAEVSSSSEEEMRDGSRKKYDIEEVKAAIERGLEYLNETQHPDGGWVDRYGKNTNMIGSALRSFVDYNATDPRWQDAIEGAVRFLKYTWHDPEDYPAGQQRDRHGGLINNDVFHPTYTHGSMYSHGSATAALIDYYFHTRDIGILPYINASVDLIVRAQNTPHKPSTMGGPRNQGGWRYEPWTTSSDTSLSGWNMHALVLAESSGIYDVPDWSFEYSVKWLKRCSSGSGFGYSGSYTSYTNTAVGTYCMLLMGKENDPATQGALQSIKNWGPNYRIGRFYYTYHATLAMYLVGGEEWKDWNEKVRTALIDRQNQDGSWNGEFGLIWGTAMAINTLNVGISKPNEVSLEPQKDPDTGDEDPMVKLVEPEQTVTYNITVGSALGFVETPLNQPYEDKDKIELTISEPLPGWSAELDTPGTPDDGKVRPDGSRLWWVELSMRERDNVTLHVTAPPLGKMSEPCVVNVIGTLHNEYGVTQAKLATISILDIDVDFEMEFLAEKDEFTGKKMGSIAPGEKKVYQAYLKNKGNINDSYDIKLISPSNWEVMFDNALDVWNISLSKASYSSDQVIINVTIEAPITASKGERVDITIMGVSTMFSELGLGTLKRTDQLSLTVTGLPALVMHCEKDNKHVDPGSIVKYEIAIVNNFESTLEVTFKFSGTGTILNSLQIFSYNWSAGFPTKNVAIKSRERLKVIFQIGAPSFAIAGTRKVIEIGATGYDNFGMEYEANPISVTAITNLIASISASASPLSQRADPGENVNYTVTVTNEGNGDDIADLQISDLPLGWDHEFSSTSKYLDPYQEVNVDLMVKVSENALADADPSTDELDPYRIGINISGREKVLNYGETLYVDLWVEKKPDCTISSDKSSKFAPPRSTADFVLKVENRGNSIDEVRLNISDAAEGDLSIYFPYISLNHKMNSLTTLKDINFSAVIDTMSMERDVLYIPTSEAFDELTLKLDVGQRVYVALHARIPPKKKEDTYSFSVEALCQGDINQRDNRETFNIDIIMPDLYVDREISHTKLKVGKIASFTAKVGNMGNLTASDVRVSLYVDDEEVDTRTLPRVVIGDEKIVTFVWPVAEGEHSVKVAVDPDNKLAEENEANNLARDKVEIGKSGVWGGVQQVIGSPSWMVFILILIGLAGAGIVYAVHHFKNKY